MRKQTIQYTSSLDALVAVAKRLSVYENQQKIDSEDFFISIIREHYQMMFYL